MKICVAIPTLNEEKNIINIFSQIKKNKIKLDILFIDDNSSDKSQELIIKLSKKYKHVNYIFRKKKVGIGSAHKEAIQNIYKKKYDLLITMDADGTHDPKYFKKMILNAKKYDYVITSRFIESGLIKDWPLFRKLITYTRHMLVKIFLGMSLDASGAYRCFYLKKISLKDILEAKNNDYAFFWEVTYIIKKRGYSIYEIPVKLIYRKLGKSKMKLKHIIYSLFYLLKIFLFQK
jgi:dolichol-phosphate mannosyltransferase|tara:strand:+ start:112 stop:810 length:699 start_codon:yes stop_codon:yes gene_type:complete